MRAKPVVSIHPIRTHSRTPQAPSPSSLRISRSAGGNRLQALINSLPASPEWIWLGAIFAGLLGLAFGSFLNVCLARWPEGQSIVSPGSHCRNCDHTLAWWENLPVLSWIMLRGRCRACRTPIAIRYPLIELAVAALWTGCWLRFGVHIFPWEFTEKEFPPPVRHTLILLLGYFLVCWLLVALAALDAEYFWLPDWLTLPGTAIGFAFTLLRGWSGHAVVPENMFSRYPGLSGSALRSAFAILAAAGLILVIRLAYWLVRRREGMGLGDAKLMAMLGAWLGLEAAFESFAIAVFAAAFAAILWLAWLAIRRQTSGWAALPLPLGTFLCLAALSEIFAPNWLWTWWLGRFLP